MHDKVHSHHHIVWFCGRYGTLNLPDMHEEALAAMRAGNAKALGRAIRADIAQGHNQIRRALEEA